MLHTIHISYCTHTHAVMLLLSLCVLFHSISIICSRPRRLLVSFIMRAYRNILPRGAPRRKFNPRGQITRTFKRHILYIKLNYNYRGENSLARLRCLLTEGPGFLSFYWVLREDDGRRIAYMRCASSYSRCNAVRFRKAVILRERRRTVFLLILLRGGQFWFKKKNKFFVNFRRII